MKEIEFEMQKIISLATAIADNTALRNKLEKYQHEQLQTIIAQILHKGFISREELLQLTSYLRYIR
jgi:hypothetical protein